jgi:molecular chaperone Hsp33
LLIQNIAEDDARGSTAEAWTTAQALFETVGEDELVDPRVSTGDLLWRLFHEDGVRLFKAKPLRASCRCSETRIVEVLNSFPAEERAAMIEPDGHIRVTCEYCARVYDVAPEKVG